MHGAEGEVAISWLLVVCALRINVTCICWHVRTKTRHRIHSDSSRFSVAIMHAYATGSDLSFGSIDGADTKQRDCDLARFICDMFCVQPRLVELKTLYLCLAIPLIAHH